MDDFSVIVLERTLELATEELFAKQTPSAAECVDVIRRYMIVSETDSASDSGRMLLVRAITDLLEIADQKRHFLISIRLRPIAAQLGIAPSPQ